ncbi:hypothetical protein BOTNAR_0017g00010 [Botryotinia narcissicola]|uniref:Peptidase M20 dimerisation domain-containing protein n=1 Tax=Botryotinia narcissicola TaxID=278944 RepID=A0A4Z1J5Q3_9HELO|nr:hypothetical protein BOTNAR_0017g00010 [Botryotinia narcissicola]
MDDATFFSQAIGQYDEKLKAINQKVAAAFYPYTIAPYLTELGFNEIKAHDNITSMLKELGYSVTTGAYGVPTAFSAEYGSGGRLVVYNAEYDALPDIGHACGHNLIATASIASFLGLAAAIKENNIPGRVRLLGTPAEEGGGGKLKLIDAGAYKDVDACMMVHPSTRDPSHGLVGSAYSTTLANHKINTYADTRPNKPICYQYAQAMESLKYPVTCDFKHIDNAPGSTDMGNVTYECPGFHGWYGISDTAFNHTPQFTQAAATKEAHDITILTAKAMAIVGWKILTDDEIADSVRKDFEEDKILREKPRGVVSVGGAC